MPTADGSHATCMCLRCCAGFIAKLSACCLFKCRHGSQYFVSVISALVQKILVDGACDVNDFFLLSPIIQRDISCRLFIYASEDRRKLLKLKRILSTNFLDYRLYWYFRLLYFFVFSLLHHVIAWGDKFMLTRFNLDFVHYLLVLWLLLFITSTYSFMNKHLKIYIFVWVTRSFDQISSKTGRYIKYRLP